MDLLTVYQIGHRKERYAYQEPTEQGCVLAGIKAVAEAAFAEGVKAQKQNAKRVADWRMSATSDPKPQVENPYEEEVAE